MEKERLPWIAAAVLLLFGFFLFLVWPYLWLLTTLLICLMVGGVGFVLGGWWLKLRGVYLEQNKMRKVIPPVDGRLPAVIRSSGEVEALEDPPLPPGLKLVYQVRNSSREVGGKSEASPLALPEPLRPVAPKLERARGDFRPGGLVLGYTPSGPVRLGLEDVGSVGIVGKSGMGKSTTIRYLALQFGGELHVWDPHASIGLPGAKFDAGEMAEDAMYLREVYENRKALFATGVRVFDSLCLVVDEWKELYRVLKKYKELLSDFITGGRKFGINLVISSQYLKAEMFEGSGDLDSIKTRFLHWTDTRQAEYARASEEETKTMLELMKKWGPKGYAVVSNPTLESAIVSVPDVGEEVFRR